MNHRIVGSFALACLVTACGDAPPETTGTQRQQLPTNDNATMCTYETCEDVEEVVIHPGGGWSTGPGGSHGGGSGAGPDPGAGGGGSPEPDPCAGATGYGMCRPEPTPLERCLAACEAGGDVLYRMCNSMPSAAAKAACWAVAEMSGTQTCRNMCYTTLGD